MVVLVRWAVVLFAASTLPVTAWPHEVYGDSAKLAPCPRPSYYLRSVEFGKQASAEIKAGRWQMANGLLDKALTVLGRHYDPYVRVLDDTGQHLSLALVLEREGKLAEAVREKQSTLKDRLDMQIDPMLCNKTITRMAW